LLETGNDIEQRALAAPAWPNEADELASLGVQIHFLEYSKRLPVLEHIFADTFHPDFGISPHLDRRIAGDPLHGTPHQSCTKRKAALSGRLRVIIKSTSSQRWHMLGQGSGMVPNHEDLSV
jgi:hypothetical protein